MRFKKKYEASLQNLKEVARIRHIPLKEVAERAGISEAGLMKAFRTNGMTLKTAILLCKTLNIPIEFLVLPFDEAVKYLDNFDNDQKIKELEAEIMDLQKLVINAYKKTL